jgi:hypothetical protein
MDCPFEIGRTYEVDCPFVRDVYNGFGEDGPFTTLTWRPGIHWEATGPEDSAPIAHGMGKALYTVVSFHVLPRPYPPRLFFTRKWLTPDGNTFGKGALRIMTKAAFERRLKGYRFAGWHEDAELIVRDLSSDEQQKLKAAA